MLCRYTLELFKDTPGLRGNLIPREELANWEQAEELLNRAHTKAAELIRQAEKKCEALLETSSLEIWQRADTQFKRWERDRQAMLDNLEQYATSITNQAIRCVLDETVAPKRLAAMLKQLMANQVPEIEAALLCHPNDFEEIKQCLATHKPMFWKLHADGSTPSQTLVLKTDEGDFRISWRSMLDTFFIHSNEYRINI
ncbi:hypothetical protein cym2001_08990 [Pseudomonas sp. CYM-20-01]|jgi:type III secretion protein L|uniref:type III secretion system stator protein SctL n=1 Tax=Pseudomonas sp. CYM-20-01 TaxID=2870750 RepID=UPI0020590059|nr:type III secretion system stator protein SctL [Pseudomonas sp. CYM-20-01]BDB17534.1 hypothetical protein cym2001_08990 [Pseudomonas sp. CYM-20-01]